MRSNSRLRLARRPRRWQQPACAWGGDGRPSHPHLRGHGVHVRGPRPEPHGRCIHHAGLERVDLGWSSFFPARRTEAPCRTTTSRRSTSTTECTTSPQVHTTPRPRAGHMGRSHSAVTPTPIRVRRARRTRPAVSATRARGMGGSLRGAGSGITCGASLWTKIIKVCRGQKGSTTGGETRG